MNIIDTNVVQHILTNNLALKGAYYLAPDIAEEVEMAKMPSGKRLPPQILKITQSRYYDGAIYLKHYQYILNEYGGRSFFNMTGFGDVSILAVLLMLMELIELQKQTQLFNDFNQVTVYTSDKPLMKKVEKEMRGRNVVLRPIIDIS